MEFPRISLYEITLALRARKPIVVFIEDSVPSAVVPGRLLQRRFSRRSFLRQVREHRQALSSLRAYIGEQAPPRYQPSLGRRSCLIVRARDLPRGLSAEFILDLLSREFQYDAMSTTEEPSPILEAQDWWDTVQAVDVVLAVTGPNLRAAEAYALGVVRGALRPLIHLTTDPHYAVHGTVPVDYHPRKVTSFDGKGFRDIVRRELDLLEEDFLDVDTQDEVTRYAQKLIELDGNYSSQTREQVRVSVMGDQYNVHGQAAAVGPNAHVHDVQFNQVWSEASNDIGLPVLAQEVELLRAEARRQASTPEEDAAVAALGQAEIAAREGDGPRTLSHLAKSGRWALTVAQGVGVGVAAGAIKAALGL